MRILAAMSGGVDSAVAAARAVDAGHDVVGVHLALSRAGGTLRTGSRGCCTIEDAMDARRVADKLGIPFYVWDFSERFRDDVIDDFVAEYQAGRTPNPCMRCNEKIKFAALLEKALALGFDAVCTGHYASIVTDADGNRQLHRAAAWAKDQSYVLGVLNAQQLAHTYFPLGSTPSKAIVRAEAAERGIPLSLARLSFDAAREARIGKDAARLLTRLVRTVDFACRDEDGALLIAFTQTDLRSAHVVARRIAGQIKSALLALQPGRDAIAANLTLATLKADDTLDSLLARVAGGRMVAAE